MPGTQQSQKSVSSSAVNYEVLASWNLEPAFPKSKPSSASFMIGGWSDLYQVNIHGPLTCARHSSGCSALSPDSKDTGGNLEK